MVPRHRLDDAARVLTPYRQGDLDGLCGLYAIINAVQLALYPRRLRRAEREALFGYGLEALDQRQRLKQTITSGLHNAPWLQLCRLLVAEARDLTGEPLTMVLPAARTIRTTDDALGTIRRHLRRGRPVLLELRGRLTHWTVVVAMSEARLTLFDSAGNRWILLRSVQLIRGRARPTHGIFATGIVAVRRLRSAKSRMSDQSVMDRRSNPP